MQNTEFNFHASKIYLILLGISLGIAVLAILFSELNIIVNLFLLTISLVYVYYHANRYGWLRSKDSIVSIKKQVDDSWLINTNGEIHRGEIQGDSIVTNVLCILRFRITKKIFPYNCIVLRDSLKHDDFRKLLVILRQL